MNIFIAIIINTIASKLEIIVGSSAPATFAITNCDEYAIIDAIITGIIPPSKGLDPSFLSPFAK